MRGPSATKRTRLEWLPLPVLCLHRGLIFSYIIKTALSKKQGIYVLSKMCLHLSFDDLHTLVVVGPFKKKTREHDKLREVGEQRPRKFHTD